VLLPPIVLPLCHSTLCLNCTTTHRATTRLPCLCCTTTHHASTALLHCVPLPPRCLLLCCRHTRVAVALLGVVPLQSCHSCCAAGSPAVTVVPWPSHCCPLHCEVLLCVVSLQLMPPIATAVRSCHKVPLCIVSPLHCCVSCYGHCAAVCPAVAVTLPPIAPQPVVSRGTATCRVVAVAATTVRSCHGALLCLCHQCTAACRAMALLQTKPKARKKKKGKRATHHH